MRSARFHCQRLFAAFVALGATIGPAAAQNVPKDFSVVLVASGLAEPVAAEFAADGRLFIVERRGVVRIIQDGKLLAEPFIDLRDEVNSQGDRGMLGIVLDADFLTNHHVYFLYTVDPDEQDPDEPFSQGTLARITRYTGTPESDGNVADLSSRLVLVGDRPGEGIPVCDASHANGNLEFGHDGSLFATAGDAAHFEFMDDGGADPECFQPPLFDAAEDIGAFRSQYLGSLAGKLMRLDPDTGLGFDTNPYWTGDGSDKRSKVWAYGLRNPYRFAVRPDTPAPGAVFIADVGWGAYEEIDIALGGENFGWPCFEGPTEESNYANNGNPAHHDCTTIETPQNPGPLTAPLAYWHHGVGALSDPPGVIGAAATGAVFYEGDSYPAIYRGALFYADYSHQWIRALEIDDANQIVELHDFGTSMGNVVDLSVHPITGEVHYVSIFDGEVRRLVFEGGIPGDLDGDGTVGSTDLVILLGMWGACDDCNNCSADLDGDCTVGTPDLLILLGNWG